MYAGFLLPATIVAALTHVLFFTPWKNLPQWLTWPLLIGPALGVGAVVYALVARWLLRYVGGARLLGVRGHLTRCTSLYVAGLSSVVVVLLGQENPDFGLYGALFVLAAAASFGGIVADGMMARRLWRVGGV